METSWNNRHWESQFATNARGHSISTWTRWGGEVKKCLFLSTLREKTVDASTQEGWVKKWQNSVHVVVECPPIRRKKWSHMKPSWSLYTRCIGYSRKNEVVFNIDERTLHLYSLHHFQGKINLIIHDTSCEQGQNSNFHC